MDWQGQKLSEQLMQYLLLGSACCAFITGLYTSSYRSMLNVYLVGVAITFLFTVPEWSYFNRHPLEWFHPCTDWPSSRELRIHEQKLQKQQDQEQAEKSFLQQVEKNSVQADSNR